MTERMSADIARENNEPLYGTIKAADVWLLLEYNGVYTNKAWEDARISDAVKDKLAAYPNSRPLLIRQPEQLNAHDRIVSLFLVDAVADQPVIYHLEFESYDDILQVDLDTLRAGQLVPPIEYPLYVICTNGKRDVCCSKYGVALYNAMTKHAQHHVWQSSHIGGHRFAGTLYCFPHALCYGFVNAEDAEAVIDSYTHDRLLLDKLRGHAIYPKHIQAAEYFLRREFDYAELNNFSMISVNEQPDSTWNIRFVIHSSLYEVKLTTGKPLQVIATTGDTAFKDIPQYKLLSIEQVQST